MNRDMSNVHKLEFKDKEVILIGTAHVSQKSADDVEYVVREENPDAIGVELDEKRYKIIHKLSDNRRYSVQDFLDALFKGKLPEYLTMMLISLPQDRLSKKFDIKPGSEMIKGIDLSKELDKDLLLLDRDVNVTLSRLTYAIPIWAMPLFGLSALASLIMVEFIKPDDIEKLRSMDNLEQATDKIKRFMPKVLESLVDERDKIISYNILKADYKKIVAVVGAGHIKGIKKYLDMGITEDDIKELNEEKKFTIFKDFL